MLQRCGPGKPGQLEDSTCLRGYQEHEGLYDASMAMVSIDFNDIAAVIKMGATGVSAENALAVFKHIAGAVSWTR